MAGLGKVTTVSMNYEASEQWQLGKGILTELAQDAVSLWNPRESRQRPLAVRTVLCQCQRLWQKTRPDVPLWVGEGYKERKGKRADGVICLRWHACALVAIILVRWNKSFRVCPFRRMCAWSVQLRFTDEALFLRRNDGKYIIGSRPAVYSRTSRLSAKDHDCPIYGLPFLFHLFNQGIYLLFLLILSLLHNEKIMGRWLACPLPWYISQ